MNPDDPISAPEELSRQAIQNEVTLILASEKFGRSKKLRSLLQFTVEQTLQGNAGMLKEYVIGTEVLKKPDTYDPRRDSLVRVMASRLRVKLKEYYSNGGAADPLVIEIPKGQYVPRFQTRESLQITLDHKLRARAACSHAKFLASTFTEEALKESAGHFQEAIEADRPLVMAHAGLANVRALQAFLGFGRPNETWPAVRAASKTALELDDMGAEAQVCLGMAEAFFDWRWHAAESHFDKAIEIDPYSAAGYLWRAVAVLIPTGQMLAAQAEIARARELAPAPFLEEARVLALYFAGNYEAVLDLTEHLSNAQPGASWSLWIRGLCLAALGWLQASVDLLKGLSTGNPRVLSSLAYVYGLSGEPVEALCALDRCSQSSVWISNYDLALIQIGLGNHTAALALLESALVEREPWMAFLTVDPRLRPLRDEAQFTTMSRRCNVT